VTTFTTLPETPAMDIVILVTERTCRGQADSFSDGIFVAGMTIQTFMLAVKLVVGLAVVIETPEFPSIRIVTELAFVAEPLLVRVISPVTGFTVQWGTLERS